SFVKLDILDGIRVESREKAEEVRRIVNGGMIQQDERLIGASAANVKATRNVRSGLNTRQHLQRSEHIGLEKPGYLLNEFGIQSYFTDHDGLTIFALRFHDQLVKLIIFRLQTTKIGRASCRETGLTW